MTTLPPDRPAAGQADPSAHAATARMRGFAARTPVDMALAWIDGAALPLSAETITVAEAAGRVLACDVRSLVDVPGFDRAMMDGFSLRAEETQGASVYNPLRFVVVGEALPGRPFAGTVQPGQAVRTMTGAPLPDGADAVLPVEQVEIGDQHILATEQLPAGKHVGRRGEDIAAGATVASLGRRLRPQDLGVLSSVGVGQVSVVRRPRVRIIVTGNELLPAGTPPHGFQIADANGPMLAALAARDGAIVSSAGLVPDDEPALTAALVDDCRRDAIDVVLVSGGSSVGQEDHAPELIARWGDLAIHGLAMRPSSPAGMGTIDRRIVFLLPGNPVSCLCAYDFFAGRAIRRLGGRATEWPYTRHRGPLARKLSSMVGRLDYARVRVVDGAIEPLAISGASMLSSTTRADGFVVVAAGSEGYAAGAEVDVWLYDQPRDAGWGI